MHFDVNKTRFCKICNAKLVEFRRTSAPTHEWECKKENHRYWCKITENNKIYHEEYNYDDYIIMTKFKDYKPFVFDIYKGENKSRKNYLISLDYESWSQLPIENSNEFVNKLNRLLVFV